jgi:hypothetical protein
MFKQAAIRTSRLRSASAPQRAGLMSRADTPGRHIAVQDTAAGLEDALARSPMRSADRLPQARHDLSGVGASPFPHRSAIESTFHRAIPGRAVIDAAGCGQQGVPAFTRGDISHFASPNVPLKVAAHEAAHLLQHAGTTRDAGLGAESHANAVARLVTGGRPAETLLGSAGAAVSDRFHRYTEIAVPAQADDKWKAGAPLRVADDGNMAVAEESPSNHRFWAKPTLIGASNTALSAKKSVIKLKAASDTLNGPAPDGSGKRVLSRVIAENQANHTSGDSMKLWADCGMSSRDVAGAGQGTGWGSMTADYQEIHRPWYTQIPILGPLLGWIFGGPRAENKKTSSTDPEEMKKEIFNEKLGGTGDEGLKKYEAMSADEKDRFDRETKINKYATPGVGQGFTMSSGGADIAPAGQFTWNFHWAGVIMSSGSDRITLENYSVSDPTVENSEWQFEMYGPAGKLGQTFYEQHKASKQHGDAPTAMQVEKQGP